MVEANREWFVRLKDYLVKRYKAAKELRERDGGCGAVASCPDLPEAPIIAVNCMSPYNAMITVTNSEVNASCEEQLFVVKYRTVPHVGSARSSHG